MEKDPCGGERSVPEFGNFTPFLPTASNSNLFKKNHFNLSSLICTLIPKFWYIIGI